MRYGIEISSEVSGFTLSAPEECQKYENRHVFVIEADGSNQRYLGSGILEVHVVYTNCTQDEIRRWTEDIAYCLEMPATDMPTSLKLQEKFDDPEYSGVILVISSHEMGSRPFFELVVAPSTQQPLN